MDCLTVDRLKLSLHYDADTGVFTRLSTSNFNPKAKCGCQAGSVSHGYRYIRVGKPRYAAHRLAWFYVNGVWPNGELDHVDGDGDNNRIANLREATRGQNMANAGLSCANKSGMKGVFFDKNRNCYLASMQVDRKTRYIGSYDTFEEAAEARRAAFVKEFGGFARV